MDLIFLDRLRVLKDEDTGNHLRLVPEAPIVVEDPRQGWCLGRSNIKSRFESALIIMYVFPIQFLNIFKIHKGTNEIKKGGVKMPYLRSDSFPYHQLF